MSSIEFAIVDVFSTEAFTGNPLAVVNNLADSLTTTQMQLVTRQFNLSETTFFLRATTSRADYRFRSFLPNGREVFGAGHNILGAWWHLAQAGFLDLSNPHSVDPIDGLETFVFHQELGGDVTPVKVLRSKAGEISISLRQAPPQSHSYHPDPAALAASFGATESDIGFSTGSLTLKPQVMSTSTTRHLIVPLSSIAALDSAQVQMDLLLKQLVAVDDKAYGLYLVTPDSSSSDKTTLQARFFTPAISGEDPATGSAAGPLSAYLARNGYLELEGGKAQILVRQGLKIGRKCVIKVIVSESTEEEGRLEVDVIGGGAVVASGKLTAPDFATAFVTSV
ncbi:hypothetical protein jhhlp_008547 [Lomentospora prolificans]|uniref:Phenazine biosynthesis protein n=1 Tax=Lomentospora prolificans TaxID=41688 RepID=A0A2N3MYC2_9PEZI|nr:hypothetical protein jhhlp_008547 [Lomentospora prolificans]